MTKPTFRVGMKRPTNIYVALDPVNPENDPQIGYIIEGWAEVLVNQANEDPAWTTNTTSAVMSKARDRSVERLVAAARVERLAAAARAVSFHYGQFAGVEDITDELRGCLDELWDAAKPFAPYNQDGE